MVNGFLKVYRLIITMLKAMLEEEVKRFFGAYSRHCKTNFKIN